MSYILLNQDGTIKTYPYSISLLRSDNPNISFPTEVSDRLLTEYNVFPVIPTSQPEYTYSQGIRELDPVLIDNNWIQVWEIYDLDQDELIIKTEQQATHIRQQRDRLLFHTDWRVVKDVELGITLDSNWMKYRDSLRNIPQQEGFPWNVIWPEQP